MYLPFYYRIFLYYILINFIIYYVLNLSKNHIPKSVLFAYKKQKHATNLLTVGIRLILGT